jgi:predicted amidohydrolase YtcJ
MLNQSTIVIIASCLLFASSGCDDLSQNRISASNPANSEVPAESPFAQEAPADVSHGAPAADLVIINAKVVTIDKDNPRAQAVAFKGETIIAVTSNECIEKYIKEGISKVIDAEGRLVVPSFNDAHVHFNFIDPDYIDLRYTKDPSIITKKVAEAVAKARPRELIRGGHWEHEMFHDRQWPSKELIDPVAPNNPVVVFRADGHSVLVNSYVIRNSGITSQTPDPFGGEIQRNPVTAEPTGIFKETAMGLLKYGEVPVHRTAEQQQERLMRGWQAAFDMAAKNGVTSIQLPPGEGVDVYQKFKDMDKLTLRVYFGGRFTADEQKLKHYAELQKKYPRDGNWIRFGYLKGFIDGTLGSGTALFYEPYVDVPETTGLPMMPREEFEQMVLTADKAGFQMGIHAIGDRGNRIDAAYTLHNRQAFCRKTNRQETLPGGLCLAAAVGHRGSDRLWFRLPR